MSKHNIKVVELFAGVGGFRIGLEGASDAGPHDGSSCTEQLEIIHATSIRA